MRLSNVLRWLSIIGFLTMILFAGVIAFRRILPEQYKTGYNAPMADYKGAGPYDRDGERDA